MMVVTIKAQPRSNRSARDSFWSVTGSVNRITAGMEIHIDGSNDVPIRRQLTEQIMFLIATQRLRDGELLPSVRELARRLKVHHNTVSEAYQDLVQRKWLERRRGSRLAVLTRGTQPDAVTLDDLINKTITMARASGYSLQQLRERVRERLLLEPPDHLLVVEQDDGLRDLIREEFRAAVKCVVNGCTREELEANPEKGAAKAREFLDLAGDLYDEGHLDGEQYSAVYDLGRSLKEPGLPETADLARRCRSMI